MHSLILRNTLSTCDMGEKESNTFFRVRLRPNFKLSDHLYTLPWCHCNPRRKNFVADLYRLVVMTLTFPWWASRVEVMLSEMRFITGPSWIWSFLLLPVLAIPSLNNTMRTADQTSPKHSAGRFRHICPEEKEALVEFQVRLSQFCWEK